MLTFFDGSCIFSSVNTNSNSKGAEMNKHQMHQKLKTYIAAEPGNLLRISLALGYKSINAIRSWIRNESIPDHKQAEFLRFLNGKEK